MSLEKVFELVRREDVILWVGSGFSLYAGYPSGAELAGIIYNSLSREEKKEIPPDLQLAELSEQVTRLSPNGRKHLEVILEREFLRQPMSTKWHQILSKIPHIRTIVTTNYDRLFELTYRDRIQTIISSIEKPLTKEKVELFKVHGDINKPESILITRGDYTKHAYQEIHNSLMWSIIKERIVNKHVVFVGYDLEDENIKMILQHVADSLGENQKEMFLIAPKLKPHKVRYLEANRVQYLNFKGEVFIDRLYQNIQDQITTDFARKMVSPDTLRKFYQENCLHAELKMAGDRFVVSSVRGNPQISGQLQIGLKPESNLRELLYPLIEGDSFDDITLDGNVLSDLKLILNDVNIVENRPGDFKLKFSSKPVNEGKAIVVFDNGCEYDEVQYRLFISRKSSQIVVAYRTAKISLIVDATELADNSKRNIQARMDYKHSGKFVSSNDAIATVELLKNIADGVGFTVYLDGSYKGTHLTLGKVNFPLKQIENNLEFFEGLKSIEQHFKVRFSNFDSYSKKDVKSLRMALLSASGDLHQQFWDEEIKINITENTPVEFLSLIEQGNYLTIKSTVEEVVLIYDLEIPIGFMTAYPQDLFIVNAEAIKSGKSKKAIIRSRSKSVKICFEKSQ